MEKHLSNLIRVTVYISPTAYRRLKSVLALEGVSVSGWVRQQIAKKIEGK